MLKKIGNPWSYQVKLVAMIKSILESYPNFSFPKEMLQNADDAGASKVCFMVDERTFPNEKKIKGLSTQGPALVTSNNSVFTTEDFQGISSIAEGSKKEDPLKIGQHGRGFTSCYHLTDNPEILSGSKLMFFDAKNDVPEFEKEGSFMIDFVENWKDVQEGLRDQIEPFRVLGNKFDGPFPGTIFRFPLRKKESVISKTCFTTDEVLSFLMDFVKNGIKNILFLRNVMNIEIYHMKTGWKEPKCLFKAELKVIGKSIKPRSRFLTLKPVDSLDIDKIELGLDSKEKHSFIYSSVYSGKSRSVSRKKLEILDFPLSTIAIEVQGKKILVKEGKCFVGLPLDLKTGVNFHIDSNFQLDNNRRNIWKVESVSKSVQSRQQKQSTWNNFLLTEDLPRGFINLIKSLLLDKITENIYFLFPNLSGKIHHVLQEMADKIWHLALDEDLFYCETTSTFINIDDGVYLENNMSDFRDILLQLKVKLFKFPEFIKKSLSKIDGSKLRIINDYKSLFGSIKQNSQNSKSLKPTQKEKLRQFFIENSTDITSDQAKYIQKFEIFKIRSSKRSYYTNLEKFNTTYLVDKNIDPSLIELKEAFIDWNTSGEKILYSEILSSVVLSIKEIYGKFIFPLVTWMTIRNRNRFYEKLIHTLFREYSNLIKDSNSFQNLINDACHIPTFDKENKFLGYKKFNCLFNPQNQTLDYLYSECNDYQYFISEKFLTKNLSILIQQKNIEVRNKIKPIDVERFIKRKSAPDTCKIIKILEENTNLIKENQEKWTSMFQKIKSKKWILVSQSKKPMPFSYFSNNENYETIEKIRTIDELEIIGACMSVTSVKLTDFIKYDLFGISKIPPLKYLLQQWISVMNYYDKFKEDYSVQTGNVLQMFLIDSSPEKKQDKISEIYTDLMLTIYKKINWYSFVRSGTQEKKLLDKLKKLPSIWDGKSWDYPHVFSKNSSSSLTPFLKKLPNQYANLVNFSRNLDISQNHSFETLCGTFSKIKKSKKSFEVKCKSWIKLLVIMNQYYNDEFCQIEDSLELPTKKEKFIKTEHVFYIRDQDLYNDYSDHGTTYHILTKSFPEELKERLRIQSFKEFLIESGSEDIKWKGQNEELTTRLKNIIEDYDLKNCTLIKEMLQNADDAGATQFWVVLDETEYETKKLLNPALSGFQGPSLLFYNNGVFSQKDWSRLAQLASKGKLKEIGKTGQFGLGINVLYNLTDIITIASKDKISILDPNKICFKSTVGRMFSRNSTLMASGFCKDQWEPFKCVGYDINISFNGTVIRVPLRTTEQSKKSKISKEVHTASKITKEIFTPFKKQAEDFLLFAKNVDSIRIIHQSNKQISNYKVTRTIDKEIKRELIRNLNKLERLFAPNYDRNLEWLFTHNKNLGSIPPINYDITIKKWKGKELDSEAKWKINCTYNTEKKIVKQYKTQRKNRKQRLLPFSGSCVKWNEKEGFPIQMQDGKIFSTFRLPIPDTGFNYYLNGFFYMTKSRKLLASFTDNSQEQLFSLFFDSIAGLNSYLLEGINVEHLGKFYQLIQVWRNKSISTKFRPLFYKKIMTKKIFLSKFSKKCYNIKQCRFLEEKKSQNKLVKNLIKDHLVVVFIPGEIIRILKEFTKFEFLKTENILNHYNNIDSSYYSWSICNCLEDFWNFIKPKTNSQSKLHLKYRGLPIKNFKNRIVKFPDHKMTLFNNEACKKYFDEYESSMISWDFTKNIGPLGILWESVNEEMIGEIIISQKRKLSEENFLTFLYLFKENFKYLWSIYESEKLSRYEIYPVRVRKTLIYLTLKKLQETAYKSNSKEILPILEKLSVNFIFHGLLKRAPRDFLKILVKIGSYELDKLSKGEKKLICSTLLGSLQGKYYGQGKKWYVERQLKSLPIFLDLNGNYCRLESRNYYFISTCNLDKLENLRWIRLPQSPWEYYVKIDKHYTTISIIEKILATEQFYKLSRENEMKLLNALVKEGLYINKNLKDALKNLCYKNLGGHSPHDLWIPNEKFIEIFTPPHRKIGMYGLSKKLVEFMMSLGSKTQINLVYSAKYLSNYPGRFTKKDYIYFWQHACSSLKLNWEINELKIFPCYKNGKQSLGTRNECVPFRYYDICSTSSPISIKELDSCTPSQNRPKLHSILEHLNTINDVQKIIGKVYKFMVFITDGELKKNQLQLSLTPVICIKGKMYKPTQVFFQLPFDYGSRYKSFEYSLVVEDNLKDFSERKIKDVFKRLGVRDLPSLEKCKKIICEIYENSKRYKNDSKLALFLIKHLCRNQRFVDLEYLLNSRGELKTIDEILINDDITIFRSIKSEKINMLHIGLMKFKDQFKLKTLSSCIKPGFEITQGIVTNKSIKNVNRILKSKLFNDGLNVLHRHIIKNKKQESEDDKREFFILVNELKSYTVCISEEIKPRFILKETGEDITKDDLANNPNLFVKSDGKKKRIYVLKHKCENESCLAFLISQEIEGLLNDQLPFEKIIGLLSWNPEDYSSLFGLWNLKDVEMSQFLKIENKKMNMMKKNKERECGCEISKNDITKIKKVYDINYLEYGESIVLKDENEKYYYSAIVKIEKGNVVVIAPKNSGNVKTTVEFIYTLKKSTKKQNNDSIVVKKIVESFKCPLTQDIFEHPVIVDSGITYSKNEILEYFRRTKNSNGEYTCPVSKKKISDRIIPNYSLISLMSEMKQF